MSYKDISVHNLGDSGAYGLIPEDFYLRKIEQSALKEDPYVIEDHMRKLLVDFRPDDPFLASDDPRDPSDRGSGPHSTQFLNLRHYGVFGEEADPYLPDGTFLDFEFTEKDPRGIATGPDMRKHMEQQYARSAFIKFSNDEDWSIPETGINPVKMVENIKSGMYQYKDRYKNFNESQDSWHNGGTVQTGRVHNSTINNVTTDGTIKDLTDTSQINRRDAVSMLSNDPTIAFRQSVPDHRFKIAHYGFTRVNQDKNYQNWSNNRGSTFLDHANMAMVNGELVNKSLARLILDLQGQRKIREQVVQGDRFNDSAVNQAARKRIDTADVYKALQIGGMVSASASANEAFTDKRVHRYNVLPKCDQRETSKLVEHNHFVADAIVQAVKRIKGRSEADLLDLREYVHTSSPEANPSQTSVNKHLSKHSATANQTRSAVDTRYIEQQRTSMNYSGAKPMSNRNALSNAATEQYGSISLNTIDRQGRRTNSTNKSVVNNEYEQDLNKLDFGTFDKATKERPKYGRNSQYAMDNSGLEDSEQVKEIEGYNFRLN